MAVDRVSDGAAGSQTPRLDGSRAGNSRALVPVARPGWLERSRRLWRRVPWRIVGPAISLLLFAGALTVLARILREVNADDVMAAFTATSPAALGLSLLGTIGSYLALTGYDGLALRQINARDVPYSTAAIGSFTSSAISYTLGFPLLTAAGVRYRVYSAAGLTAPQIAALTLVCTLTFWLGMGSVLAVGLLVRPHAVTDVDRLPGLANMGIGVVVAAVALGYVAFVSSRRRTIQLEGWLMALPGGRVTLAQIGLGVFDVCCGAGALYALLPAGMASGYVDFLVIYVLAALLGTVSHAPGGIGVFETTLLVAMPEVPPDHLLGSILLFRCVYYFLPFMVALLTLGLYEVASRRHAVGRIMDRATAVAGPLAPLLIGGAVFLAGAAVLVTGSLPLGAARRETLRVLAPLSLVEASSLLAAMVGVGLLFVSGGLLRRLAGAWQAAALLLGAAAALVVMRGADLRLALLLLAVLGVVLAGRPAFPRTASLFNRTVPGAGLTAILAVLGITVWVALVAFRRESPSAVSWVTASFEADLPRVLRSTTLALASAVVLAALSVRPRRRPALGTARPLDIAPFVAASAMPSARLALLDDKTILTTPARDAILMHAVRGGSMIALGDPLGSPAGAAETVWSLRERAERRGLTPALLGVSDRLRPACLEAGFALTHVGDRAVVGLASPALPDDAPEVLAWGDARALSVDLVPAGQAGPLLPELAAVASQWLAARDRRDGFFTLGRFTPDWLQRNDVAVLRQAGAVAGFAVLLHGAGHATVGPDILRVRPELGPRALDFLLMRMMRLAAARGARSFDLGLTPTPDLEAGGLGPTWARVSPRVFGLGEHIADFDELRAFKARFAPSYEPRYLASPGSWTLPQILLDASALIEEGSEPDPPARQASRQPSPPAAR